MRRTRHIRLAAVAVALGCTERPVEEEPAPDEVYRAYAEARCGGLQRCGCLAEADLPSCADDAVAMLEDLARIYPTPLDAACLQTVPDKWTDGSCIAEDYAPEFEMCELVLGIEEGEPCPTERLDDRFIHEENCADGFYCREGTCAPVYVVPEGDRCIDHLDCADGNLCIEERCSAERVALGEPCVDHRHCEGWFTLSDFCDHGTCT